jgi:hypothetical protein
MARNILLSFDYLTDRKVAGKIAFGLVLAV